MKYRLIIITLISLSLQNAQADMFGGADFKIITELKAMYSKMKETLHEAKTSSEALSSVRSTLTDMNDTRNGIQNFDANRIVRMINRDIANITEMDNLDGMNSQQKIRAVQRMLNKRIEDPDTTDKDQTRYEREVKILDDIHSRNEILELTNANATKNLDQTTTDLSTRDSSRIAAESLATLASIESQRQIDENIQKTEKIRDQQSLHNINRQSIKLLENAESEGW